MFCITATGSGLALHIAVCNLQVALSLFDQQCNVRHNIQCIVKAVSHLRAIAKDHVDCIIKCLSHSCSLSACGSGVELCW